MIHRAFYECFDNAVTHSRREVNSNQSLSVKIAYTLTGEHVLITVRNQGAIPEEEKGVETREVFAKPVAGAPNDGKGRLGLPLVQRIVGLFGGNMRMSSVGDDEVKVMMEFPTGAPQRGQSQLDIAQAQRYASDLAQLMSRRKKEK
jgi:anti-sigma regulatory factor (Ser/Thr protein kinase)